MAPAHNTSPVILNIATSLDGYIARTNGDVSWLDAMDDADEDYGMGAFMTSVSSLIMGSHTYEAIVELGLEHWPYDTNSFVLSHRNLAVPWEGITVMNESASRVVNHCRSQGDGAIWLVGGAEVVASFLASDLIDIMIISVVPVTLERGISLFTSTPMDESFMHVDSKHFNNGLLQLRYERTER